MNVLLDNTFSTNHYISVSEKIKKLSMFFLYFNTVEDVKFLDTNYRKIMDKELTAEQQTIIKYKILHFHDECTTEHINCVFQSPKFGKCLYHLFYSANILHNNQMSYTMVHFNDDKDSICNSPFVMQLNNSFPLINNFSNSFFFPIVNLRNAKLYFSRSLLTNPYICIDVFLITYLLHLNIDIFTRQHITDVFDLYIKERPFNDNKMVLKSLEYFIDYKKNDIVNYLLQFKYTWTYFSFCYFFILYYQEQLHVNGLYEICLKYTQSSSVDRNKNILKDIHSIIFDI
tara:strand:+ start:377 stop:1234 length:858 start_codon:yes stop_codon:yes gene_type:complete